MITQSEHSQESSLPRPMDIATTCVYGLSFLSAGLFMFLPLVNLLSPSPWQRYIGAIHGFAALLATFVISYAGHLAFPLLRGVQKILPQMRTPPHTSHTLYNITMHHHQINNNPLLTPDS